MARRSAIETQASRRRILDSAASLMRERGFDGVGIDAIVAKAALTPGAFYTHFGSKLALFSEVVNEALDYAEQRMPPLNTVQDVERFSQLYLRDKAVKELGTGCIIGALSADIHRQGGAIREAAGNYVALIHGRIASVLSQRDPETAQDEAWRIVSQLVGALILARMLPDDLATAAISAVLAPMDVAQMGQSPNATSNI